MSSEIALNVEQVLPALAAAGTDTNVRTAILNALREADNGPEFRENVRWPIVQALLADSPHQITLTSGLIFEMQTDSRIEKAALLSAEEHPDHIWEPQTTKLLMHLATGARDVIVGGAYIGDHALPIARKAQCVHAFEPMWEAYARLMRNIEVNGLSNVLAHCMGLWDRSDVNLSVEGDLALASAVEGGTVPSITIDRYATYRTVDLIMLDTEGGEERALIGARKTLERDKPNIVFEIHRNFVDWSDGLENTSIVQMLTDLGYKIFAIRDYHDNTATAHLPLEIIPIDKCYLDGPPHGFNCLAMQTQPDFARVVENVSPKLIPEKDPALFGPRVFNITRA